MSIIVGVKLENRCENSVNFQEILSKYGCNINMRVGFHESDNISCSKTGIILFNFIGSDEVFSKLIKDLIKINNLKLRVMRI